MERHSKIYVAGHRGMVGSAIWRSLSQKGYTNLVGRSFEELDLTSQEAAARFFAEEKPAYVFLAAARVGGIVANNTYRGEFIYDNLMIQNNVIHQAYLHGVKKLLFLGSTCIYPKEASQPMKEEYLLTGLLECTNEPYAIAKIAGIKLCESYNLQYGTNFMSVMPTNLYGPNDNFDLETSHVLPALIRKIHLGKCLEGNDWSAIRNDFDRRRAVGLDAGSGQDEMLAKLDAFGIRLTDEKAAGGRSEPVPVSVEIWGSGRPMREFMWSEDMADACVFVMENIDVKDLLANDTSSGFPAPFDAAQGPPFDAAATPHQYSSQPHFLNIGTGQEVSIRDLAELLKHTIGFRGDLVFNTSKPDGTMRKLTDPHRLHSLGWRHQTTLEAGVQRLYAWYLNDTGR